MIVEHLSLVDFRNYAAADVTLVPGPNVFLGRNGQGKTNLAEAIGYFATLGSHRVSQDAPMVRYGADAAFVRARLGYGERRIQLEAQLNRSGSNKARVNGSPVRTSELPRYAQVVLFAPEDLQIVRGDPSARRRFADQLLVQRAPRMSGVLGDYDRVLKQRTALLKSARARGMKADQLTTLDVWDDKLVSLGTEIIRARLRVADELAQPMRDAYEAIAGADHDPRLEWVLSVAGADPEEDASASTDEPLPGGVEALEASFRSALAAKRVQELDRGVTLVGPHRDDLLLRLRGLPVKGYASHGESWSTALSLRLASAQLLRDQLRLGDPIVILDDVFAELDADRRARLAGVVADFEQVIVTAAVDTDVPEPLRARTVRVEAGTIVMDADG
ncbi:DNA replication/repair protein RecF [Microbacterium sp. EYE_5]|uniref:DNA replication/repair protein RecF n=1 Tax=unclassified Microbacterium TaxID=2609290 RepID=UPI0020029BCE|nr:MULTISPECIES: DNA replication/repair protein RecF [unclassified Microbacterium]MCK6079593.1 DNA replication/repair protein RecF [Microbacterium sp. EYE_382]MCK6084864.1 DNA replication/repair protein RecF [Microbacterium sp. EYE_384]MCK6122910.1 DNA replication/repair protein RecF [Microbacterium sp. EYE_80]MCK6125627.1 DNA replication/repair protein RecF [Microbacterium sp. EYE_79]MCK6140548.1 DNA replication/repair protein RecF [Microbacterium sp. EYE_39]